MDWDKAIAHNRQSLLALAAALAVALGFATPPLLAAVRRLLRPVESAVRRLVVIAARDLVVPVLRRSESFPALPKGKGLARPPAFRLFDRPKRFAGPAATAHRAVARCLPRLSVPGIMNARFAAPVPAQPPFNAQSLALRLASLERALADLPRQARRLKRAMARRRTLPPGPRCAGPIRPGFPPGWRSSGRHPAHRILAECHALALDREIPPP